MPSNELEGTPYQLPDKAEFFSLFDPQILKTAILRFTRPDMGYNQEQAEDQVFYRLLAKEARSSEKKRLSRLKLIS